MDRSPISAGVCECPQSAEIRNRLAHPVQSLNHQRSRPLHNQVIDIDRVTERSDATSFGQFLFRELVDAAVVTRLHLELIEAEFLHEAGLTVEAANFHQAEIVVFLFPNDFVAARIAVREQAEKIIVRVEVRQQILLDLGKFRAARKHEGIRHVTPLRCDL